MLTQQEADALMAIPKRVAPLMPIDFPTAGDETQFELKSMDGRDDFIIDINRKGRIKLSKCTYQERYAVVDTLLRLDVDGPPHENPDGTSIPCPHLHTYREGFGTKWAEPLPADFSNSPDLVKKLQEFLRYCNVAEIPEIQGAIQ
jgi:hypothetical protein